MGETRAIQSKITKLWAKTFAVTITRSSGTESQTRRSCSARNRSLSLASALFVVSWTLIVRKFGKCNFGTVGALLTVRLGTAEDISSRWCHCVSAAFTGARQKL
jgi:hypothetical protein